MKTKSISKLVALLLFVGLMVSNVPVYAQTTNPDFEVGKWLELSLDKSDVYVMNFHAPETGNYLISYHALNADCYFHFTDGTNGIKLIQAYKGSSLRSTVYLKKGDWYVGYLYLDSDGTVDQDTVLLSLLPVD